jgi:hypothetical protein
VKIAYINKWIIHLIIVLVITSSMLLSMTLQFPNPLMTISELSSKCNGSFKILLCITQFPKDGNSSCSSNYGFSNVYNSIPKEWKSSCSSNYGFLNTVSKNAATSLPHYILLTTDHTKIMYRSHNIPSRTIPIIHIKRQYVMSLTKLDQFFPKTSVSLLPSDGLTFRQTLGQQAVIPL